jgi:hypothetical protein
MRERGMDSRSEEPRPMRGIGTNLLLRRIIRIIAAAAAATLMALV